MFGSGKKQTNKSTNTGGIIGPDGRRVDSLTPDNRVKLQRTDAEIKTLQSQTAGEGADESSSTILPARVILNEFSLAGVGAYTADFISLAGC